MSRPPRPRHFDLSDPESADTNGLEMHKKKAGRIPEGDIRCLEQVQELLYAQDCWSVLVIFQAMDAGSRDPRPSCRESIVKAARNAFQQPTRGALDHDLSWRAAIGLPSRGRIAILNRS
jgi:polyphosphate kinase 2 (PPK2 family)